MLGINWIQSSGGELIKIPISIELFNRSSKSVCDCEVLTLIEYTQSFSGVESNQCEAAVPLVQKATANALGTTEDLVTVSPGPGCDEYVVILS